MPLHGKSCSLKICKLKISVIVSQVIPWRAVAGITHLVTDFFDYNKAVKHEEKMKNGLHNLNVWSIAPLPTPEEIKKTYPLDEAARTTVLTTRQEIARILLGEDKRILAVVGPCSIHNPKEVLRYAAKLAPLALEVKDQLLVVMRFCGDKPRTGKDWPGFWNDPRIDGSCDIASGWVEGRKLAIDILKMGLPVGCEVLDAENFQRFDDIPSYVWLGARDVGSQRMRKITSAITTPVGFKNHNTGGVKIALDAMEVAVGSNVFVASNDRGVSSRFFTKGNRFCHLIHRGTEAGPNYDADNISKSVQDLVHRGFNTKIVVDASHGNSRKYHRNQAGVIADVVGQVLSGRGAIAGIMYESYLEEGRQAIPQDLSDLRPDISITAGCDDWVTTESVLREAHGRLATRSKP